ncbi:tyrosine-type recombinase/integrase [Lachnospiraceae bacterium 48-42]
MQINYLDAVSSVLNMMKQPDSACKNIDMHRTCYTTLFKHLMEKGIPFSVDAALDWLEIKKQEISYETCSQYRNALFRLEHYLLFGDIESPFCRSEDSFFCRSGMSESFFRLTYELEKYYAANQNPSYYHTYSVATKEFFRLATSLGITEPEAVTIDTLIEYWNTYCKSCGSPDRCQNAVCAMTVLMKYLHLRGDVPECYQPVLFGGNAEILPGMKLPKTGAAFHPSVPLEHKAEEYLDALDDWKYTESSKAVYRNDFTWYFMFLELKRLEHSAETVALWIDILPDCPNQSKASNSVSAHRSHTIKMFEKYLQGTMESNMTADPKRASDHLPPWSKSILDGFIENRRRDGMTNHTLTMCRAAGCGFFKYLEDNGIDNPLSITPHVVKAFHNHDVHSTPESKNAYGAKLRQLLRYMADQDLVPPTLVFAVSAICAPHRSIADVLSDDMVEKIYEYREKASTPIELRDTAMVMLGLRMGIRGADILKLQVNDFDWKNKTVSFIQQKTGKAITLPVPTDAGNSVYKYIMNGRPEAAATGSGYIFIRHQAPYIPLKVTTACRGALKRILAEYGFELSAGQGFHMTRKTFATRMLRADNKLDDISNALGHARQETAEVYLERDEDRMRLCPLEFGGVLS